MAVTSAELLKSVELLLRSATCEADYRNVIGRAYYSSYHGALVFHASLATPGLLTAAGGVHAQLVGRLVNPTVPDQLMRRRSISVGYTLKALLEIRRLADYELDHDFVADDAEGASIQALGLAAKIAQ